MSAQSVRNICVNPVVVHSQRRSVISTFADPSSAAVADIIFNTQSRRSLSIALINPLQTSLTELLFLRGQDYLMTGSLSIPIQYIRKIILSFHDPVRVSTA